MALQNIYLIASLTALLFTIPSSASNTNFSFVKFNEADHINYFNFSDDTSSIDSGALQLTPDSTNDAFNKNNKSGRIFYRQPFALWPDDGQNDGVAASFSSVFVINIYRKEGWVAGEGFTFLIAPNTSIPMNSYGRYLGLTNSSTDGNPDNKIVAVEFDTEKQDFDPDGNHIGLNINSVESVSVTSLKSFEISPPEINTTNYAVWVDHDGRAKRIKVYMTKQGGPKPARPLLDQPLNLRGVVNRVSYFGFSGSTGDPQIQLNCVLQWNLTVEEFETKKEEKKKEDYSKWIKIGAGAGVPVVVLLVCAVCYFGAGLIKERRRKVDEEAEVVDEVSKLADMARVYRYKELKNATNDFSDSMVLGQGGFGIVYRGVLRDKGTGDSSSGGGGEIAVKKFSRDNIKGKGDFLAELNIIHRLRHKNLVRLVGWCYEKGKLFLVYDYMSNGSLDQHLYNEDGSSPKALSWSLRYNILSGVASALNYLHNSYYQKVLHRDLKPSNIMLDKDFNALLGDFGLARALENERNSYAELGLVGAQGTMGYVAPECFHAGRATPESDVFGFGAVVLEVVCGRHPVIKIQHGENEYSLIDWVWMLHREGRIEEAVDSRLAGEYDTEEAQRLLFLGLACCHPIASERPKTSDVFQIILKAVPAPHVPPFRPVFMWPSIGANAYSTESGIVDSGMTLTSSPDVSRSGRMLKTGSARLLV